MDSQSVQFGDLTDKCLLAIFKYCSLESLVALSDCSKRLRGLIEKEHFSQIREYNCSIILDGKYEDGTFLFCTESGFKKAYTKIIRHGKMFAKIGRFIHSLKIQISYTSSVLEPVALYDKDEMANVSALIARLLRRFGECVEDNVNNMEIDIYFFDRRWFNDLKVLAQNVRSVKMTFHFFIPNEYKVNLMKTFPKVEFLHLVSYYYNLTNGGNYSMPSLKKLIVDSANAKCRKTFDKLKRANPQLEKVHYHKKMKDSPSNVNLIVCPIKGSWKASFKRFPKYTMLETVTIKEIRFEEFNEVLVDLKRLTGLRVLSLEVKEYDYNAISEDTSDESDDSDEDDSSDYGYLVDKEVIVNAFLDEFETYSEDYVEDSDGSVGEAELARTEVYLIDIARKLKSLEEFHISNRPLTKEFCIDFVRNAKNLKIFCFKESGLTVTNQFINELKSAGNGQLKVYF